MKRIGLFIASIGILLACSTPSKAETGIGLVFGAPVNVGLSLRFDNIAIGAGWSLNDNGFLAVDADYWLDKNNLADKLDWFYGLGVGVRLADQFKLDVRVPVGLQWMPASQWEVFGQIVPALRVIDKIGFEIGGAVGVRYIL